MRDDDPVPQPIIRVSAVVLRDRQGRVLGVRKRGTTRFMQPGGKPEPGETPAETAVRECAEELGVTLDPAKLALLGVFEAPAANEAGHVVRATVFTHPYVEVAGVAAEIDELRWVDIESVLPDDLAPLFEHHVIPVLLAARSRATATGRRGGADASSALRRDLDTSHRRARRP